jgi:hypothetical protein
MANFDPADTGYIDVAARIAAFRDIYPSGTLQPADLTKPYAIEKIADQTYIVVVAAAYRDPQDARPGIGMAYEVFPGRTPYTKGSELQNAETSAWGRAIVATLAADTKRGIASHEEVRNRQAERDEQPRPQAIRQPKPIDVATARALVAKAGADKGMDLAAVGREYNEWSKGQQIQDCADVKVLEEFRAYLSKRAAA